MSPSIRPLAPLWFLAAAAALLSPRGAFAAKKISFNRDVRPILSGDL